MIMRIRTHSTGKLRISTRIAPGVWISQDADENLSADPAGRAFCALPFVVSAALASLFVLILVLGRRLPSSLNDRALELFAVGGCFAIVVLPFAAYIDWRASGGRRVLRHLLYGLAIGAAIAFLLPSRS